MIGYRELTQDDLKQPSLDGLNALLREIIEELNRRQGIGGPVLFESAADMQGNRVSNLAAPQAAGDAVSKEYAEANFVTLAKLHKTLEATGSNILQTTRRLNDPAQREVHSTFLVDTGQIPATTNNSTVTVVANGANSDITVSAGTGEFADGTKFTYPQRLDTVVNPVTGSNFYYYYYDVVSRSVKFTGPFTANLPVNKFEANRDGRSFIAMAQVNSGGGGTGGGGGDPGGQGGCVEVGTPLDFDGREHWVRQEPCEEWVELEFENGEKLCVAMNTLISCFCAAQTLVQGCMIQLHGGRIGRLRSVHIAHWKSTKLVVHSEPDHIYYAGSMGVVTHNFKPI